MDEICVGGQDLLRAERQERKWGKFKLKLGLVINQPKQNKFIYYGLTYVKTNWHFTSIRDERVKPATCNVKYRTSITPLDLYAMNPLILFIFKCKVF